MKYWFFATVLIVVLNSCSKSCPSEDSLKGYFMDQSGLAVLEVQKQADGKWRLGNSYGSLTGDLNCNTIKGLTSLKDTFSMEIHGDSALYTIMGIPSNYKRVDKQGFDKVDLRQN
jgi:hypothetical protein